MKIPTYSYLCGSCENVTEDIASMSSFKDHKPKCSSCGGVCSYIFIPSVPQIAFKDGPSGGWPSKANRFKDYRAKRSVEMEKRQRDRYGHINRNCLPNYQGKQTESWREAQSIAEKDRGKEAGSSFTEFVKKEEKKP
jgi:predicted nucleic acid-binding Zn ribbon protein